MSGIVQPNTSKNRDCFSVQRPQKPFDRNNLVRDSRRSCRVVNVRSHNHSSLQSCLFCCVADIEFREGQNGLSQQEPAVSSLKSNQPGPRYRHSNVDWAQGNSKDSLFVSGVSGVELEGKVIGQCFGVINKNVVLVVPERRLRS